MKKKILQESARFKSDSIADKMYFESSNLIYEINELVACRKKWGFSYQDMARECSVSVSTIKRFEALKIDSLSLYFNYKMIF